MEKVNEMIGKRVIIRSTYAGVFYGILEEKDDDEVVLSDCRRLWYWDGAASLSQLAIDGVAYPENCKFTVRINSICIIGVCEIILCSEKAVKSIEGVSEWKI